MTMTNGATRQLPELQKHHWAWDGVVDLGERPGGVQLGPAEPHRQIPTERQLRKFLDDIVRVIDMKAIAAPTVVVDERANPNEWWAYQLIAESHISIHGRGRRLLIDVFSCRAFNPRLVAAAIYCWFGGAYTMQELRPPLGFSARPQLYPPLRPAPRGALR
jgi:hypothetical protein